MENLQVQEYPRFTVVTPEPFGKYTLTPRHTMVCDISDSQEPDALQKTKRRYPSHILIYSMVAYLPYSHEDSRRAATAYATTHTRDGILDISDLTFLDPNDEELMIQSMWNLDAKEMMTDLFGTGTTLRLKDGYVVTI